MKWATSFGIVGRVAGRARLVMAVVLATLGLGVELTSASPPVSAQDCPGTVHEGICFPTGDVAFADATVLLERGERTGPNPNGHELSPLGPPDDPGDPVTGEATAASASLGDGGTLVVQFTDNVLSGGGTPDADLWTFEGGRFERTFVEVSADGARWTSLGATTDVNTGFDLDAAGFGPEAQLSFVRLTDDPDQFDEPFVHPTYGADIDADGVVTALPSAATCNGLAATITGAGEIEGSSGHEVIVGSAGADVITGSSGHDTICGGGGANVINGDSGNDVVIGSGTLIGDSGNDVITATDPNSPIDGGSGTDTCTGAAQVVDCEG